MEQFKAYRLYNEDGQTRARFVEMRVDELDPGEVLIKTAFSSINYKDALAATGMGKVIRRFPCVGGIDVAGTVTESTDPRYQEGDPVICTSYDLGVSHDGGFSEYTRVPADWVVPLPHGMTLFDAMAIGTAGYTAALGIHLMEQNDLSPASGKVVVNGATGGVASLAIDMLAARGYHVVAITGKESETEFLKNIGAVEVLSRHALEMGTRPLEKPLWAGAVDSLGGEPLAWLLRTMQQNGVVAGIGNAASVELHTTVFPFILRGVRLLGIDSGYTAMPTRRKIWDRLIGDLKPRHLAAIAHMVEFDELPQVLDQAIKAQLRGRTVVKVAG
jgi:acrylyl-CoA reductase (NADPH)